MRRPPLFRGRFGFTMVELLVVIVVIAILAGLLVPAVMRAVRTAKEAAVSAEINQMAQALADFKSRYGEYPPSRIVVNENGDYSAAGLSTLAALGPRSITALRRMFPRMVLSTQGPVASIPGGFYDFNGNGTNDSAPSGTGAYELMGPECLVFFLGGIPQATSGGGWGMTGFAKNPLNPMINATAASTNRTPPLFEFNNSRFIDARQYNTGGNIPVPGFPAYCDSLNPLPSPGAAAGPGYVPPVYVYFSSYGGLGYDPADVDMTENTDDDTITGIKGAFYTNNWVIPSAAPFVGAGVKPSFAPNPYTNDVPCQAAVQKPVAYQNPQSFQILTAGADGLFGIGGQYAASATTTKLPVNPNDATFTGQTLPADIRSRERDNITNFAPGKLE